MESAPYWQIACRSKDLGRKPLQVLVSSRSVVLYRPAPGQVAALEDRCAHRNAPLSLGRVCDGHLQCAYHGWSYDAQGRVANIPALTTCAPAAGEIRIPHFKVLEQDGFVWIAPAQATGAPPSFPYLRTPGWTSFTLQTRFTGTVEACLENFLDCPHATFVHKYWFRAPTAKPVRAVVKALEDGAVAEFFAEPRKKSLVWWLLAPRRGQMRHTDRFIAPAMSRVDYEFPSGLHYIISSFCTERTPAQTEVFTVISFKWGRLGPLIRLYFEPLSRRIIKQDVEMLAHQQTTIERFGAPCFVSSPADLLGRHIVAWRQALRSGAAAPEAGHEQEIDIRL
jgi:phenylpropionate dioxygenase-like ring-hydroxylating dioxygenase large terminal subunit